MELHVGGTGTVAIVESRVLCSQKDQKPFMATVKVATGGSTLEMTTRDFGRLFKLGPSGALIMENGRYVPNFADGETVDVSFNIGVNDFTKKTELIITGIKPADLEALYAAKLKKLQAAKQSKP